MPTLTRRGLIVLGGTGAAGAVLAACGSEEERRDSGEDAALLMAAYEAESALTAAYAATTGELDGEQAAAVEQFERNSRLRAEDLQTRADGAAEEGEAPTETGLAGAIAAAEAAIAAYRDAAGLLSEEEDRALAIGFVVPVAAELAAVREFDGADPVPYAFVTGGSEPPFVAPDETATEDDE
jgi:hypothetical protein